jgi:hypothetical protein
MSRDDTGRRGKSPSRGRHGPEESCPLCAGRLEAEGVKYMANAPGFVGKAAITSLVHAKWPQYESRKMSITVFKRQADGSWKIYRDCIGPTP